MEWKHERIELLQTAIKQILEEEKKSLDPNLVAADYGGEDKDDDHRLLFKLLSQLEEFREDVLAEKPDNRHADIEKKEDLSEQKIDQTRKNKAVEEEEECSSTSSAEEIVRELRKVRRQNLITQCLLSVMIVLTVGWQLSEVSLILKVKEGFTHPFRSIGGALAGMFKSRMATGNGKDEEKHDSPRPAQNPVVESSLPGLKIPVPELPHVDLPVLNLDRKS